MKLLLDANLSPWLVGPLGLLAANDDTIFEHAAAERCVVITADSDFPMMLALRRATAPSVVLLRHDTNIPPSVPTALLAAEQDRLLLHCRDVSEATVRAVSEVQGAIAHGLAPSRALLMAAFSGRLT